MTTERELFEAWFVRDYHPNSLQPMEGGCYLNRGAGMAWDAWQAARTQPATPDKLRDVLQLGLDAAEQVLTERKQALAGYPHKWRIEQEAVDTIRAALATPAQQGEPPAPVVPALTDAQFAKLVQQYVPDQGERWNLRAFAEAAFSLAAAPQPLPPVVQQARQPLTQTSIEKLFCDRIDIRADEYIEADTDTYRKGQWFRRGWQAAQDYFGITGEQP